MEEDMNVEMPAEAVLKVTVWYLYVGDSEGGEICGKDVSDWMLGETLGKDYLERLWKLSQ